MTAAMTNTGFVACRSYAAVPTAKTVYILAHGYKVEEPLVAATISITTLLSVVTLLVWLYILPGVPSHTSAPAPSAWEAAHEPA